MPRSTVGRDDAHYLQLSAINQSRHLERSNHPISLKSFYGEESDSDGSVHHPLVRARSVAGDYPIDGRGKYCVPNAAAGAAETGKRFRRKIKKIADREKNTINDSRNSDELIETTRGFENKNHGELSKLIETTLDVPNKSMRGLSLAIMTKQLKMARMKLFATRTAIEVQPKLIEKLNLAPTGKKHQKTEDSPGVYSLHASMVLEQNRINADKAIAHGKSTVPTVTDAEMRMLVSKCRTDAALNQHLLYDQKYDKKWKYRYTDVFLSDKNEKKPENRRGWVLPLKKICDQAGMPSRFFTDDRLVELPEARMKVLYMRLMAEQEASPWLINFDEAAVQNPVIVAYLNQDFDPIGFQDRISLYVDHVRSDVDKVVTGKYYNNIMLGKRMFGPSKKQMFESSIIGGIERRFEILDNQVNHIPFTHHASDVNKNRCRHPHIHCRDSTRVVLSYPAAATDDFIHANRIKGGPLFNEFIVTQAPMDNTIGDFWRMVWQEKVPYVFMLSSRKEADKCAEYWPRKITSEPIECHGLVIQNAGVNTSYDPLFRITSIRIMGPEGQEHRLEHWQGNMNNSSNLMSPLNLLRIARNCSRPVVVHDTLGISRASCLVAIEIAICSLIKGPSYKHLVQQSVQFLRSKRPFSVETPMQFIFIHRVIQHMFRNIELHVPGFQRDYQKWLKNRATRMFVDDLCSPLPGYRLLSPKVDPDLLRQARRPPRPNYRREAPDCVGEWPLPFDTLPRSLF